jgi:hypothetical protein
MGMDLAMRRKCVSWLWRAIGIPADIHADMLTGNVHLKVPVNSQPVLLLTLRTMAA